MESSTENPKFDAMIGGKEEVPFALNLQDFTKYRIEEILMLTETLKESPFKGKAFQRLPKHMRRRQMSHNSKRLPRRLQNAQFLNPKDTIPATPKRPSRKFRRRASNLLLEYNRRQKKNIWLETHIWHAKRFHMIKKWGYKLPYKRADKSFRASYRATSQHCLITDVSYYNAIELSGPEQALLDGLMQCVSTDCGLTFRAKMFINGTREGCVTLYYPNSYPYQAIGSIRFLWRPIIDEDVNRSIWIWCHPLMHDEIVECFRNLFGLEKQEVEEKEMEIEEVTNEKVKKVKRSKKTKKDKNKNIEQIKLEIKNVPFVRTPKFVDKKSSVSMILLKDTLNRFSLTGPLSQAVVSKAFSVVNVSSVPLSTKNDPDDVTIVEIKGDNLKNLKRSREENEVDKKPFKKIKCDYNKEKEWWDEHYADEKKFKCWEKQKDFYKELEKCQSPTDVPGNIVLSVIVRDPRLTIPDKRVKCVPEDRGIEIPHMGAIGPELCYSPLWEPNIRDKVSFSKMSTVEINTAKSKQIVPGTNSGEQINGKRQPRLPLILIQKPGERDPGKKLGYGSGWDIIIPAGYAMPVWLSLIFRGARSGGVRETETLQLETSNLSIALQPDSTAGETENLIRSQELREKYFRLPPNKRPNYIKLGSASPFSCPWNALVSDWDSQNNEQTFYVLRNKKKLKELSDAVENHRKMAKSQKKINFNDEIYSNERNSIIAVSIECIDKGKPKDFAMICLPTLEDLEKYKSKELGPVEIIHDDDNANARKLLRKDHIKNLKSLKRTRRKEKEKLLENLQNRPLNEKITKKFLIKKKLDDNDPSKKASVVYNKKMESLWLPETVETVIDSASRKILGFVTKGDFSFSKADGFGVGYVALPGLLKLLKVCRKERAEPVILVRNPDHVQYRFAKIKILI